jgi:hypothetical protein
MLSIFLGYVPAADSIGNGDAIPLVRLEPCNGIMSEPLYVAELRASLFQEYDCLREPESSLKQSSLVDDVHSCLHAAISHLILSSHDEQCNCRSVEHFGEASDVGNTSHGYAVELVPWKPEAVLYEIFQLAPKVRFAMPDKDVRSNPISSHLPAVPPLQMRRRFSGNLSSRFADAE